MTNLKAFENAESLLSAETRIVAFTQHNLIGGIKFRGTYHAIEARLFDLSYPNYLRYIRDNYNATLQGRTGFSYATFKNSEDCDRLVKELNRRWNIIIAERNKRGLAVEEVS